MRCRRDQWLEIDPPRSAGPADYQEWIVPEI